MPYYILPVSEMQMNFAGLSMENGRFLHDSRMSGGIFPYSGVDFSVEAVYFK